MKIFALVPVKRFESSKSRLSSVLNVVERKELSELLLINTLSVLREASAISEIVIVSSDQVAMEIARRNGAKVLRESKDGGVNAAIARADDYSSENGAEATLVIPQDLPLLVAADVNMICRKAESADRCLVVSPSIRYDGSNALLRKPSRLLKTSYDEDSFNAHIRAATKVGIPIKVFLSKRIMLDLDTTEDIKILMNKAITNLPLDYLKSKLKMFNRIGSNH
ncbi:MAG TPA: 2-phospho-L-lactate guanylyltransferase [Candidatus Bathyarchaeia archaeon]|nr:2-phospho-L-lactate guanylyltransferase [Candidatus Bathyarchaeia archaeon]